MRREEGGCGGEVHWLAAAAHFRRTSCVGSRSAPFGRHFGIALTACELLTVSQE